MAFKGGQLRVFNRSGTPMGTISEVSVIGPRSYRLNDVEDFAFSIPRNDGPVTLVGAAIAPLLVGTSTASNTLGLVTINDPVGVLTDDFMVAVVSYDRAGDPTAAVLPPAGWQRIREDIIGNDHGVVSFSRRVRAGDPTTRDFHSSSDQHAVVAMLVYRGVQSISAAEGGGFGSPGTSHIAPHVAVATAQSTLLSVYGASSAASWTSGSSGLTERADVSLPNASLSVYSRIETAITDEAASAWASASASVLARTQSIVLQPTHGSQELLARDNLIYCANSITAMPGWAGSIDDVLYVDGTAQVRCIGTLGLLGGLSTSLIEQDDGDTFTIAQRFVLAANAKQGAHGDLLLEIVRDGTKPNHGRFSYEGDILRGLQALQGDSLSEFYMENRIDPTGKLRAILHWGGSGVAGHLGEYRVDHTLDRLPSGKLMVLKDGPGGNLSPGTQVDFTGAERVNYGVLQGQQSNVAQYVDYSAVMNVAQDVVPEVIVNIPEPQMPGSRRRERLDISVNWGLSRDRQKAMAAAVQQQYLDYYQRFLAGYHQRFGAPFLDGFDWSGPDPDQFQKLSMRNYRTAHTLGIIGQRDVVTNWDPESDSDVSLEGWHFERSFVAGQVVGVAFDYTETRYRWAANLNLFGQTNVIVSFMSTDPYTSLPGSTLNVVKSGETLSGISTHPADPNVIWVLSNAAAVSWVRKWDLGSKSPVSEFSIADPAINDIAVDVPNALLWTVKGDAALQKRDLNNGTLLASYTTGIPATVGIAVSGGIGYVAGAAGAIEMRFLADEGPSAPAGAYAGKLATGQSLRGLFVDPANCEVWLMQTDNTIAVYSAAVAIATVGGPGPVDGAPGFPAISKGTFVHVVMTDNRDVGQPPGDPHGLLDVTFLNQFGRYVGGVWTLWPDTTWPGGGGSHNYNSVNCTMAAASMLLDRHTYHTVQKTPVEMRTASGDHAGGSNLGDIKKAWDSFGQTLHYEFSGTWDNVISRLKAGRGVLLQGDYDHVPARYRCQHLWHAPGDPRGSNPSRHATYLHSLRADGDIWVYDPLCRRRKHIPSSVMRAYAGAFAGKMGRADSAWSRDTTGQQSGSGGGSTGAAGKKLSFYVVFSEGKWKETFSAGAPGQAIQMTKTWDPGDQKHGFKHKAQVIVADPHQVIYGEEGRVADWDPVTMGYGKQGDHWYVTQHGDVMKSTGWYLAPWDVPLSTFAFAPPDWPEGQAYLQTVLEKFNREQGQQALGLVNLDAVWQRIQLGGVYKLAVSLQGPHPDGISGTVRVVAFQPDEASGVMQILAEWLG